MDVTLLNFSHDYKKLKSASTMEVIEKMPFIVVTN